MSKDLGRKALSIDVSTLQCDFNELESWSTSRSLNLNVLKCTDVTCSFLRSGKLQVIWDASPLSTSKDTSCQFAYTVQHLGVYLFQNLTWSTHVLQTFHKIRRLYFYASWLKKFSVTACILRHWPYSSPIIFPGLLQKYFVLVVRSVKPISRCSGLSRDSVDDVTVWKHFDACMNFVSKILVAAFIRYIKRPQKH